MFNEFMPPFSGIGPISDGPAHPFYNNMGARLVGKNSSYRVADLNSQAAKNVMPWAIEATNKQNAMALHGTANRSAITKATRWLSIQSA